jgi:predicted kinase
MDEGMGNSMTIKNQAFIMVGVSGAGKSSIVKGIKKAGISAGMDVREFSLDQCRLDYFKVFGPKDGDYSDKQAYANAFEFCNENEKDFKPFVTAVFNNATEANILIVDNTNLSRKSRARWIEGARQKKMFITAIQVDTPLQVVIDRQSTRGDKSVPAETVRKMYMSQQQVIQCMEVDRVINIDGTKPLSFTDFASLI